MANRGCGCKSPTNQRFNENGYLEQSFDGGLTWFRVGDDQRFNAPVFPPLVGVPLPDLPCAGAKSGKEAMRIVIEQFANETTAWETILGLITLLLGILATFVGPLAPAIVGIITAVIWIIYVFGKAAFVAIDWDATLEIYRCILFCNIEDDASFTEAGWQQVKQDIVDQFDGMQETFLWNMVNSLGPVGLTNSCRVFPGLAGDCDDCNCGECDEPTLESPGIGTLLLPRPDLGAGWWQVTTTGIPNPLSPECYAEVTLGCCLHVEYQLSPGLTNAPPGNRAAWNCLDVPGFADYGVGGCQSRILFRSYEIGEFIFHIATCPPPP